MERIMIDDWRKSRTRFSTPITFSPNNVPRIGLFFGLISFSLTDFLIYRVVSHQHTFLVSHTLRIVFVPFVLLRFNKLKRISDALFSDDFAIFFFLAHNLQRYSNGMVCRFELLPSSCLFFVGHFRLLDRSSSRSTCRWQRTKSKLKECIIENLIQKSF